MSSSSITILQINDTHGYLEPHPEIIWNHDMPSLKKMGGFAKIATVFNQVRNENPGGVIALDSGDTLHGTYAAIVQQGEGMIPIINSLGLDAMTAHWEFAYGPRQLYKINQQLHYPVLAINIYEETTGQLVFPPYRVIERHGVKIGIIGIASPIVDKTMPDSFNKGLTFTIGNEEIPLYIQYLRQHEKVDLIIALSHLGFPQDIQLATETNGIDVILGGHTHNRIYEPALINNTIIMQSGALGSFIGRLDIQIKNGAMRKMEHELIQINESIPSDPIMEKKINHLLDPYRSELNTIVGMTATPLYRDTVLESTMDNFLLEAITDIAGTNLSFSNGWRYGAPIPPGPITNNDIWNIVPTNPPISLAELTGKELWEMIEENLEHTFSRNPYQQMGGYVKRSLGLHVYFKIENPYGQRIQRMFVNGKPLIKDKIYTVAFLTNQGVPKKYGNNRRNMEIHAIDALKAYLEKHKEISIGYHGSFIPI